MYKFRRTFKAANISDFFEMSRLLSKERTFANIKAAKTKIYVKCRLRCSIIDQCNLIQI